MLFKWPLTEPLKYFFIQMILTVVNANLKYIVFVPDEDIGAERYFSLSKRDETEESRDLTPSETSSGRRTTFEENGLRSELGMTSGPRKTLRSASFFSTLILERGEETELS